jgi:hypothetical protein
MCKGTSGNTIHLFYCGHLIDKYIGLYLGIETINLNNSLENKHIFYRYLFPNMFLFLV